MELSRLRLPIKIKPNDEERVRGELRRRFPVIIEAVREDFWKLMSLQRIEERSPLSGEIYLSDGGLFLYFFIPRERNFVETGCLFENEEGRNTFQGFCDTVKETLLPGLRTAEPGWQPFRPVHPNFVLMKGEASHLVPTEKDLLSAVILRDERVRSLLALLKEKPQSFLEQLIPEEEREDAQRHIEMLISHGLIEREFIVFCRSNDVQISRVSEISAIEDASSRGLKCPFCERTFSEEKIEQSLKVTPFGMKMTKPNFWLVLQVLKLLADFGIDSQNILTRAAGNARVHDIFINFEHFLILVEVKETPPKLDEIFLFFSRIDFCKPDVAIFITPTPLSDEGRLYLRKHPGLPIIVIENMDELQEDFMNIFRQKRGAYIKDVFSNLAPYTQLDIAGTISTYFLEDELAPLREIFESISQLRAEPESGMGAPEMPTAGRILAIEEEFAEEDAFVPEEVIPAGYTPMEEDLEKFSEDFEESLEIRKTEVLSADKGEDMARNEEAAEGEGKAEPAFKLEFAKKTSADLASELRALREDLYSQETEDSERLEDELVDHKATPSLIMPEGEEVPPEPAALTETGEEELETEQDASDSLLLEEQIDVEFGEEMSPGFEISQMEKAIDDSREQIARKIIDEIAVNGMSGQAPVLEEMLREFRTINSYTASILSREGLLMVGDGSGEFDSEVFGPLAVEIFRNIDSSLADIEIRDLRTIYISRSGEYIYMYPVSDYVLILHETLQGDQDDEFSQLPGEAELRDIIMKKVLEDLGKTNGVVGNIVSSTDGLSIDYAFNEDRDIDLLSSICSQIIGDNEKYLKRIGEAKLKQMVLFSEASLLSLIPLDSEGILISILEPQTSKETWKLKLGSSALMVASAFQ